MIHLNRKISDVGFSKDNIDHLGNKYLIGNGYMGIRGTAEEYTAELHPAINLSGVYDRAPGKWRESVNAPNGLYCLLHADGEWLALPEKEPRFHEQSLDLAAGLHGRRTLWRVGETGVTVESERFASMADPHAILQRYVVSVDREAELTLDSGIDSEVWDINGGHFSSVSLTEREGILSAECRTIEQGIVVTVLVGEKAPVVGETVKEGGKLLKRYRFRAEPLVSYVFEKTVTVCTSRDEDAVGLPTMLDYEEAKRRHTACWDRIWYRSEVQIEGDDEAELALNYSIYHLNCIAPRSDGVRSIPARGLSGQVYKGAIFWDTEMFMFDYFLFTDPDVAKRLLRYRITTLPGAMEKAAEYGWRGAFYAWESQEGGLDACTDYNITDVFTGRPVRTYFRDKQVHVSAAMVYALVRYLEVTGDRSVLREGGNRMLLECARFYHSLLVRYVGRDFYEIHDVVGPDEYHERVNNNAYTNRMARFTLEQAACLLRDDPICTEEERLGFLEAAKRLKVPQPDPVTGLIEQFDGYFRLEDASVETLRSRLIDPREYWGGADGVASHTQVNKQADVAAMLGMFPEDYPTDVMEKNWLYYEPRTEHGSSLSACMFALLACYIGRPDYAYPLFMKSAQQDYLPGSKLWLGLIFIGGTHPAAAGGAWMVASRGFAGLSIRNGCPAASKPQLPEGWARLRFRILCRGKSYLVTATAEKTLIEEEQT